MTGLAHRSLPLRQWADALRPESFFVVGAVFHYLGPSFAVLLFQYVEVLGVAWLRIASAALIFGLWRRPWRRRLWRELMFIRLTLPWGVVLGAMNCVFYLAISRLPLGTVAAIEFLPVIVLAAWGSRTRRNVVALALAVAGVYLLTDVVRVDDPLGVGLAIGNAVLFAAYIALGHRAAQVGTPSGIDALATSMIVAAVAVTPIAGAPAVEGFGSPAVLVAGIGVGVSSSVVPYVLDQMAMARLKRSTYALLISILPAMATIIGVVVLRQVPEPLEVVGVLLVAAAVSIHREPYDVV